MVPARRAVVAALAVGLLVAMLLAATPARQTDLAAGSSLTPGRLHVLPFSSGSVDPAADLVPADPHGRDLVLVQWERYGEPGIIERLSRTGVELVQPLAPVSYLVLADANQTAALREIDGMRFAGVLPAGARVADSVTAATARLRVTLTTEELPAPVVELGVQRSWTRSFTALTGQVVVVPGGRAAALRLAELPAVYSVADADADRPALRDELGSQIVATGTATPPEPGYRDFLDRIGADGSGVVVSHVDGGVDFTHPELADRVAACFDYTAGGAACAAGNTDDAIGHGTHTLGIVLGTGSTGLSDLAGFDYGLGVAPGATAVVQNLINLGAFQSAPYTPVYRDAQRAGAIVSQNSWGPSSTPQGYDENTREFDAIVRDVDAETPGDQALALVFSIMNGSGGESTQGAPDEAKNIIRVGATGARGQGAPGGDDLCTCSAHGPALDGRLLPDLVAPGQMVMSTRAAQGTLCGLVVGGYSPETPVLDLPSPLHAACTGTSMASPHVTGAYAVFVDWYRQHHGGRTPSPALVKAALVNQAVDLAGNLDADGRRMAPIPNNRQGWGRVHLGNTIAAWQRGTVHVDQTQTFDDSGQRWSRTVMVDDPARPLKVTLVWTDAVGHGQGGDLPAWVNDLDLEVVSPDGTLYRGNVFADGASVPGGTADEKNNVENVFVEGPVVGTWTVRVIARNIIGDGLPNRGDATDQDFALVVANASQA